jgi:hypothetical protein
MGNKGTSTTQQQSTYTPTPAAYNAISGALTQAQNTAQLPFAIPQAPVAGFSNAQQSAFNTVNNAQGMTNPYFQQGLQNFTPSAAQAFYNPYVSSITGQLQNLFGEQMSQTTGALTQQAGGVGADRVAVGQADVAGQQTAQEGNVLAQQYTNAVQEAQAAGYGNASLASGWQNSVLGAANAQLGTGGLQQQLQQAQLNSPYQLALAQAAFPYQQSQFLTNSVGALAPGLGGTTYGTGQSTPAQPSIFSQLAGGAGVGVAALGATGAFGSNGYLTNKGSGADVPASQLGSAQNPLPGLSPSDYEGYGPGQNLVNPTSPYAVGGEVPHMDGGGSPGASTPVYSLPSGFSDNPINVSQMGVIPQSQPHPIQAHIPQINLNPPQQQSNSGSDLTTALGAIGNIAKIGAMFANRGGTVSNPYTGFDTGGDTFAARFDGDGSNAGIVPPQDPSTVAGNNPVIDRGGWDALAPAAGASNPQAAAVMQGSQNAYGYDPRITAVLDPGDVMVPRADPRKAYAQAIEDKADATGTPQVLAFSGDTGTVDKSGLPKAITNPGGDNPYAPPGQSSALSFADEGDDTKTPTEKKHEKHDAASDFTKSPWMALLAASLGIMGGSSPYAGVNIGRGGLEGVKVLEQQREAAQKDVTAEQGQRRLDLEAQHYLDQQKNAERPYKERTLAQQDAHDREKFTPSGTLVTKEGMVIPGAFNSATGEYIFKDPRTGLPYQFKEGDKIINKGEKTATISEKTAEGIADYALTTGDESRMKRLGYSGANNSLVQQKFEERKAARNISDEDYSRKKQEYAAQQATLNAEARTRGTREAQLKIILNAADAAIPAALEESRNVTRYTGYVPFDHFIQHGQLATNDDRLVTFGMANLQLAEHWAKAMNPTGVMRESDRDLALHYLDTGFSKGTYEKAVQQLKKQIDREYDAVKRGQTTIPSNGYAKPGDTETDTRKNALPDDKTQSTAPALPPEALAKLEEGKITTFGNGTKWTLKNGKPELVP